MAVSFYGSNLYFMFFIGVIMQIDDAWIIGILYGGDILATDKEFQGIGNGMILVGNKCDG